MLGDPNASDMLEDLDDDEPRLPPSPAEVERWQRIEAVAVELMAHCAPSCGVHRQRLYKALIRAKVRPMAERRYFKLCDDRECGVYGRHSHGGAFRFFWADLTESQKQWVKATATRRQMSLSAVATDLGVPQNINYPQEDEDA